MKERTERSFEAYGEPLENVMEFKYLVRVMTLGDDDWPEVGGNLCKARKSWVQLSRILSQEGGRSEGVGTFFLSGDAGGVIVWGGDVGANPRDRAGPW